MQTKQKFSMPKVKIATIIAAYGFGVCSAVTFASIFLKIWEQSFLRQTLILGLLTCIFGLVTYFLFTYLVEPHLKPYTALQRLLWAGAALLFAGILVYMNWLPLTIPGWHTLVIYASSEKNSSSQGVEVRLLEIKDETGQKITINRLKTSSGWRVENGNLSTDSQTSQTASYRFLDGKHKNFSILLATGPAAGKVILQMDGKEILKDLYDPSPGETLLRTAEVAPVEDPLWGGLIRTAVSISIGFFFFVFSFWGLWSAHPGPVPWSALAIWIGGLCIALILLFGRYDWSAKNFTFSRQGYLSSAYMLVFSLPLGYVLLRRSGMHQKAAAALVILTGTFFTLPYHWLGLERFYYYRNQPVFYPDTPNGAKFFADWLPGGLRTASMPNEALFFSGFFLLAVLCGGAYLYFQRKKQKEIHKNEWVWVGLIVSTFVLILFEVWLHQSLRSPYVYGTHYNKDLPGDWMVYLYPNQMGAVNSDYFRFQPLEQHFQGIPEQIDTMMIRRSYLYYLSSQFTYFFSPYPTYIVLNILAWIAAVACTYLYVKKLWGKYTALFSAALVTGGTGFIMFASNPMPHLYGYAIVIILIYLFEKWIVERPEFSPTDALLYGGLLGVGAMVYDIFAFYIFFLGYALLRRVPLRRVIMSLIFSFLIYQGFLILQTRVLHLELNGANTILIKWSIENVRALLSRHNLGEIYALTAALPGKYIGHLSNAFFVIPLILAGAGIFWIRGKFQAAVIALLLIPSILTLAFFHYGDSYLSTLPRLVYTAYPTIYILAALCLEQLGNNLNRLRFTKMSKLLPWGIVLVIFLLNNLDVFGYPQFYYLFYYMSGGKF